MLVTVERSPARVTWLVKFNGVIIETADRKWQAEMLRDLYQRKVG